MDVLRAPRVPAMPSRESAGAAMARLLGTTAPEGVRIGCGSESDAPWMYAAPPQHERTPTADGTTQATPGAADGCTQTSQRGSVSVPSQGSSTSGPGAPQDEVPGRTAAPCDDDASQALTSASDGPLRHDSALDVARSPADHAAASESNDEAPAASPTAAASVVDEGRLLLDELASSGDASEAVSDTPLRRDSALPVGGGVDVARDYGYGECAVHLSLPMVADEGSPARDEALDAMRFAVAFADDERSSAANGEGRPPSGTAASVTDTATLPSSVATPETAPGGATPPLHTAASDVRHDTVYRTAGFPPRVVVMEWDSAVAGTPSHVTDVRTGDPLPSAAPSASSSDGSVVTYSSGREGLVTDVRQAAWPIPLGQRLASPPRRSPTRSPPASRRSPSPPPRCVADDAPHRSGDGARVETEWVADLMETLCDDRHSTTVVARGAHGTTVSVRRPSPGGAAPPGKAPSRAPGSGSGPWRQTRGGAWIRAPPPPMKSPRRTHPDAHPDPTPSRQPQSAGEPCPAHPSQQGVHEGFSSPAAPPPPFLSPLSPHPYPVHCAPVSPPPAVYCVSVPVCVPVMPAPHGVPFMAAPMATPAPAPPPQAVGVASPVTPEPLPRHRPPEGAAAPSPRRSPGGSAGSATTGTVPPPGSKSFYGGRCYRPQAAQRFRHTPRPHLVVEARLC
eukprot:TRINITY_DN5904_c0_g2_i1.p1 TRINITY_DN5904_c0_g2~~TRINITY_DN5904_c0_g2_i1.p1  ORF type:complete len:798 (+),score=76.41 TRINITY_DN5904_c0_g2_i1:358-2394(+)